MDVTFPSSSGNPWKLRTKYLNMAIAVLESRSLSPPHRGSRRNRDATTRRDQRSGSAFQSPPHRGSRRNAHSPRCVKSLLNSFSPLLIGEVDGTSRRRAGPGSPDSFSPLLIGEVDGTHRICIPLARHRDFQSPPHRGSRRNVERAQGFQQDRLVFQSPPHRGSRRNHPEARARPPRIGLSVPSSSGKSTEPFAKKPIIA